MIMLEKKEKIIVTGGAGFIGAHLVEELVKEGYHVHVIDNLVAGKRERVPENAELHVVDIRNKEALKSIFEDAKYVFHLAALPTVSYSIENPIETHEVNTVGTLNVIMSAREAGVKRIVFSSSSAVYGDQKKLPIHEDAICVPNTPYGLQKFESEHYMRLANELYDVETVSLRYFNLYGPRQNAQGAYASVVAKFLEQHAQGEPLTIVGDGAQTRDFVHVYDVVRANILAMKNDNVGKGEIINIGGGEEFTILNVAQLFGGEVSFIPPRVEIMRSLGDTDRAKRILGWVPTISLEEGIQSLLK